MIKIVWHAIIIGITYHWLTSTVDDKVTFLFLVGVIVWSFGQLIDEFSFKHDMANK